MDFSVVNEIPPVNAGAPMSEHNKKLLEVVTSQRPGTILRIGHETYRECSRTAGFLRLRRFPVAIRRNDLYVEIR